MAPHLDRLSAQEIRKAGEWASDAWISMFGKRAAILVSSLPYDIDIGLRYESLTWTEKLSVVSLI